MDEANRDTLMAICNFIESIVAHEGSNKMSTHNMAMMFAPNIFRTRKDQEEEASDVVVDEVGEDAHTTDVTKITSTSNATVATLMVPAIIAVNVVIKKDSAQIKRKIIW